MLKEHNIPVYEDLEKVMKEKNKAIVVTATGTGKSYLTLEYIKNHNLNALVVVPRLSIGREWDKMSKKITTITYHTFARTHNFDKYDIVVFDEVHHAGANTWEEPIVNFINNTDKPVIGLTADPKRYSDGARDMGEALFKDCRIDGYDLTEAIENCILPKLTYVAALWDIGTIKESYINRNIPAPLLARFNYAIEKRKPIEEIIKERMPKGNRKGIIFVETIASTVQAEELIHGIYPDAQLWTIHSGQSTKLNDKYHNEFKKAKTGYMIAVDMYNEGLHAPGVNTIIMLRRTSSPTVFYQQIGRALHVGRSTTSIVFDCVSNSALLKVTSSGGGKVHGPSLIHNLPNISNQTVIYDYTKDILDVIDEIQKSLDQTWTEQELGILKQYYEIEKKDICKRLPDRTWDAIVRKAHSFGFYENARWTDEEIKLLKEYYLKEGSEIIKRFPGRSLERIRSKASELGITQPRRWTDEDVDILVRYYPIEGSAVADRMKVRRSPHTIQAKAQSLGLKYENWSEEEIATLVKYYPIEFSKVAERFPDKRKTQVLSKARKLGLSTPKNVWSEEEIDILREYYPIEGMDIMKRLPNRSELAVRTKASDLGLKIN